MYKLIAIDIDGTLLNNKSQLTDEVKRAVMMAQEAGVYVVLTSGRLTSSTALFANEIGLTPYVISCNGAVITDIVKNDSFYINCMDNIKAQQIIDICKENSVSFNFYSLEEIVTEKMEYSVLFYNNQNINLPEEKRNKITICNDLQKAIKNRPDIAIPKINIFDENKSIFNAILRKIKAIDDVSVLDVEHASKKTLKVGSETVTLSYYYTEATKKGVDKWQAVEYLSNMLGIAREEVICIGDNANDIEMIKNAGLGVYMSNGNPVYREYADYVAPSNEENGVADVINRFILNK